MLTRCCCSRTDDTNLELLMCRSDGSTARRFDAFVAAECTAPLAHWVTGQLNPGTFRRDWSRGLARRVFRLDGDYIGGVLFSELGRLQRTCSVRKTEKEEDHFKIITASTSIDSYVHPDAVSGKLQLPGWRDPLETEYSGLTLTRDVRDPNIFFFCYEQRRVCRAYQLSPRCRGRS